MFLADHEPEEQEFFFKKIKFLEFFKPGGRLHGFFYKFSDSFSWKVIKSNRIIQKFGFRLGFGGKQVRRVGFFHEKMHIPAVFRVFRSLACFPPFIGWKTIKTYEKTREINSNHISGGDRARSAKILPRKSAFF
jgi:hypothetical protein